MVTPGTVNLKILCTHLNEFNSVEIQGTALATSPLRFPRRIVCCTGEVAAWPDKAFNLLRDIVPITSEKKWPRL